MTAAPTACSLAAFGSGDALSIEADPRQDDRSPNMDVLLLGGALVLCSGSLVSSAFPSARGNATTYQSGFGVGKEVFAEAIHVRSPRRDRQLLKLNCAALPEALPE